MLNQLDKPATAWENSAMDYINDDLRAEFDVADRYAAMSRQTAALSSFEGPDRAFFGKCTRSFLEIFGQVKLEWLRLHRDFAAELVHVPPTGPHGGSHAERRKFDDVSGQFHCHIEISAGRCDAIDDASRERFLRSEEAASQRDLRR